MLKNIVFALVLFVVLKGSGIYPDMNFLHYAIGMCIGGIILSHMQDSEGSNKDEKDKDNDLRE